MRNETMTSVERVECAMNLEKPDRIPICPLISTSAAAALTGVEYWEIAPQGYIAQLETEIAFFDEYGGWDGVHLTLAPEAYQSVGLKTRMPSKESPEIQILEEELNTYEDYEIIAEIGWAKYAKGHLIPRIGDLKTKEDVDNLRAELVSGSLKGIEEYRKRGAHFLFPTLYMHPFFMLSLSRSMVKFTEDLYYRPEMVERALKKMTEEFIRFGMLLCEGSGIKTMGLVEERAGAFFYPLRIFERFWWPYTLQIVDAFHSKGMKVWFHVDTCWDKNIPYFKQLPRGSAIIDLDGTTDIFAAKEQLRNHLCINSDVHPVLMSVGKAEDVEAYCKKLIDEVGNDGGLLLSTGCGLPAAAKKENFEAMLRTGKTYELSK